MHDRQSSSIYYIMSSFVTRCCLLIIHRKKTSLFTPQHQIPALSHSHDQHPTPVFTKTTNHPKCLKQKHPHDLRVCLGIKVVVFLREKKRAEKILWTFPLAHWGSHQHQPTSVVGSSSSESSAQANLSLNEVQGVKMEKLGWWDNTLGCLGYMLRMKYYPVIWGL